MSPPWDEQRWPAEWGTWRPGQGPPPWVRGHGHPQRRKIFLRFMAFLGLIALLVAGGVAVLAYLFTRHFGGDHSIALLVWVGGCGLALFLPLVALGLGARVFRRYGVPLADLMEAADAVAAGNLKVRVREQGSRDFQQLAQSFNRMTEELARVDQQRRNLTADVAHELRTPLHIIQGNLEGILDGVYQPTPEHIETTLEETRQLARLVEDLRTLSLAEAGELPLVREPVDVGDLLADVATSFSVQAETAGVELRTVVNDDLGAAPKNGARLVVLGDAGRLDQVLSNLVGNAIRHTPGGGIVTLAATTVADRVTISVTDTGEGIAPGDLPHIFDRFWRADRARTHSDGAGSGLGLAIASQLVKAHGGTIQVTSEPGKGTAFTVELPGVRLTIV